MLAPSQFAVLKLSEEAQTLVRRMLELGEGPTAVAAAVRQRTGERLSRFAVSRYALRYRLRRQIEQKARQRTDQFVAQARQHGADIPEMLRAAFQEAFTEWSMNGSLRAMNPLQLETAERKRRELALKEQQMLLAQRRVEVYEDRWRVDRQQAQAEIERLERKASTGESLTPEDIRRIKEIYGIYENPAPPDEPGTGPEEADDDGNEDGTAEENQN